MHGWGGSAYLLGGINDTQAVAILEEAQHRGEDGKDQRSREVLGEEAENSFILLPPKPGGLHAIPVPRDPAPQRELCPTRQPRHHVLPRPRARAAPLLKHNSYEKMQF